MKFITKNGYRFPIEDKYGSLEQDIAKVMGITVPKSEPKKKSTVAKTGYDKDGNKINPFTGDRSKVPKHLEGFSPLEIEMIRYASGELSKNEVSEEAWKAVDRINVGKTGTSEIDKFIKANGISVENIANRPSQVAFLKDILNGAISEYNRAGIPWQVTMAQAALETEWGKRTPIDIYTGGSSNNIFGIKYAGNPTDNSNLFVRSETEENINDNELAFWEKEQAKWALKGEKLENTGKRDSKGKLIIKVIQPFRAYSSKDESIIDHSRTLNNGYYDDAMQYKNDPYRFLEEIADIYATSSEYYENGKNIMDKYLNWNGK